MLAATMPCVLLCSPHVGRLASRLTWASTSTPSAAGGQCCVGSRLLYAPIRRGTVQSDVPDTPDERLIEVHAVP